MKYFVKVVKYHNYLALTKDIFSKTLPNFTILNNLATFAFDF